LLADFDLRESKVGETKMCNTCGCRSKKKKKAKKKTTKKKAKKKKK
jgi:hypothetical protein